jgi:hypothetical protein
MSKDTTEPLPLVGDGDQLIDRAGFCRSFR